jgi:hypothetical protein
MTPSVKQNRAAYVCEERFWRPYATARSDFQ